MRVLILGGTGDANRLAAAIAERGIDAVYSYAGRTAVPAGQPLRVRKGGFGGTDGLSAFLRSEGITHVVDATHPFAVEMSANALAACAQNHTPLIAMARASWLREPDDNWIEVPDLAAAVAALPDAPSRVFLAIGRQHIAPFAAKPQHKYTLRFVDAAESALPLPRAEVIVDRGPFTLDGDLELMRMRGIAWVVARNSGGGAARAKIDAARQLRIPIIMIARPQLSARSSVQSVQQVLDWLDHG